MSLCSETFRQCLRVRVTSLKAKKVKRQYEKKKLSPIVRQFTSPCELQEGSATCRWTENVDSFDQGPNTKDVTQTQDVRTRGSSAYTSVKLLRLWAKSMVDKRVRSFPCEILAVLLLLGYWRGRLHTITQVVAVVLCAHFHQKSDFYSSTHNYDL